MNGIFTIEFDGVVAAQYRAATQAEALDRYAATLGFEDYNNLLDRVPLHERHRIIAVAPDDPQYWEQTTPTRSLITTS